MEPSRTIIPSWARQAIEGHGRRGQTRRWTTAHGSVRSGRLIVRMSAPAMVGLVVQTPCNLADTVFTGRGVGSLAIVGIPTSFPVQVLARRRVRPSAFRFEAGSWGVACGGERFRAARRGRERRSGYRKVSQSMEYRSPTVAERDELFELILAELGGQADDALAFLGMTREQFAQIYQATGEVRVIEEEGTDVGYLWIEQRGRTLHVHALILHPHARGRGIGTRVLQMLRSGFSRRVDEIELGVRDANVAAIRFYERAGFRRVPTETAPGFSIMRLSLGSP